jgi:hypothetical protein
MNKQLETLFRIHPGLNGYMTYTGAEGSDQPHTKTVSVGNFDFLPLVRENLWMTCRLDILFLARTEPMGLVTRGGDIDNRIKVFIDALRIPSKNELPPDAVPTENEKPFYCLLEDDKLITGFSVDADKLLDAPRAGEKESDVRLVVDVSIKISKVVWANIDFTSH